MKIITDKSVCLLTCDKVSKQYEEDYKGDIYICETNGEVVGRFLANGFPDFKSYDVTEIPKDFTPYKYLFDGKEFTPNPDWHEPNKYNIPDGTLNEILDDHNALLIEGGIL